MLGLYWDYIGVILELYWGYIGVILGLYWGYIGTILALYWDHIGTILGWGSRPEAACPKADHHEHLTGRFSKDNSPLRFRV